MISKIIESGKSTLKTEAQTLLNQVQMIDESFEQAVLTILHSGGKLIVTGMGKSGIIGKKMAATFASTGTPSFFLHPGEAYHGDLGMIEKKDVILALSFSGETEEILKIIPFLKSNGNAQISISGNANSTLAKNSEIHLALDVKQEACPLSLAPTSSTTATLAMGDALAVALMNERGFQPEDFARFHPGGSLGKKLLTKVKTIMKQENLSYVDVKDKLTDVINSLSTGRLGITIVLDNAMTVGIISDGDVRRDMEKYGKNSFDRCAEDIMTPNPKFVREDEDLVVATEMFTSLKISALLVQNTQGKLVGVLQIYDI